MSKLVLHSTQGADRQIALDRERITLGRRAHNDIQLDSPAVSSNHAVIITLGSDSFLEDLHSTNGTQVNQKIVHKCVLQDGDEIAIATFRLTFVAEGKAQSAPGRTISATPRSQVPPKAEHPTMVMDVMTIAPELTEQAPSALPHEAPIDFGNASPDETEPEDGAPGVIRILSRLGFGQTLVLSKPVTTLGKPGIQVVAITLRDGQYYLGIVEGDELPHVNGSEVKVLPYPLQHRDVIDIADTRLEFTLK